MYVFLCLEPSVEELHRLKLIGIKIPLNLVTTHNLSITAVCIRSTVISSLVSTLVVDETVTECRNSSYSMDQSYTMLLIGDMINWMKSRISYRWVGVMSAVWRFAKEVNMHHFNILCSPVHV
jgi:hypothetical protein